MSPENKSKVMLGACSESILHRQQGAFRSHLLDQEGGMGGDGDAQQASTGRYPGGHSFQSILPSRMRR